MPRAALQKRHFVQAAELVSAILNHEWTSELPDWADRDTADILALDTITDRNQADYLRAVWTAEAFILLFTRDNDRFDRARFLRACGLMAQKG